MGLLRQPDNRFQSPTDPTVDHSEVTAMTFPPRPRPRAGWKGAAVALGIWAAASSTSFAGGWLFKPRPRAPIVGSTHKLSHAEGAGTLGYGPPGVFPGFQGFGLGYHRGHGYGGNALGTGVTGGYPYYAGPGYPHPAPPLRRLHRLVPFAYNGGPGGPTPEQPNYYGQVGPLVAEHPVVTVGDPTDYGTGYGAFTGSMGYPESKFAPFVTEAGVEGSAGDVITPSTGTSAPPPPPEGAPMRSPMAAPPAIEVP
jgi:hypothetical protein